MKVWEKRFCVILGSNQKAEEVWEGVPNPQREPATTGGPHPPIPGTERSGASQSGQKHINLEGKCVIGFEDAAIKRHFCLRMTGVLKLGRRPDRLPQPGSWVQTLVALCVTLMSAQISIPCQEFVWRVQTAGGQQLRSVLHHSPRRACCSDEKGLSFFYSLVCVCRCIYWNWIRESLSAVTHPDRNAQQESGIGEEVTLAQGRTSRLIFSVVSSAVCVCTSIFPSVC